MSRQISADPERSCNFEEAEQGSLYPESLTALHCLARVAALHGLDLSTDRLRHAYAVTTEPIPQSLLLRMAQEAGLRARSVRLQWKALIALGEAYPALVRLANRNWIIVSGAVEEAGGEKALVVIDPLAERQDEPLVVGKQRFCANWLREAILIKRKAKRADSQQKFGLLWFIPQLLRE